MVGPLRSDGDFYTLYGVQYQQTQLSIKDVQAQNLFEACAGTELMAVVILLKGKPVGTQPIVVQVGEIVPRPWPIRHSHTAPREEVDLFIEGFGWLSEAHFSPPGKK